MLSCTGNIPAGALVLKHTRASALPTLWNCPVFDPLAFVSALQQRFSSRSAEPPRWIAPFAFRVLSLD